MAEKTVRLTSPAGVTVSVRESKASRLAGYKPVGGKPSSPASPYAGMKVDELTAEIAKRNEGRDEANLLSAEGKKGDLVAVLDADDAANQ